MVTGMIEAVPKPLADAGCARRHLQIERIDMSFWDIGERQNVLAYKMKQGSTDATAEPGP